jgi:hypothetical protein
LRLEVKEVDSNSINSSREKARKTGANRRIRRFVRLLELGVGIPLTDQPNDATLAEWIRHCKRSGLYEQGKLLYEKGGLNLDNLSEEVMVDVEEDHQVCVRMLERAPALQTDRPKRGRLMFSAIVENITFTEKH